VYLSRLEIFGFKSFPEKTILQFNGDVTAVVGPNGCGKTNILDSIRWVLGEQRTSALRSAKMEEVIFNGTAQLKPLGLAEVNLTIKNNRGVLPVEYDEVVITRRLYRSGESEYLLNKSQCRLKDIMELFYDTGMGAHAYSVIQQGMIDAILSDKAEDRRGLFEEAAGVTKYKHRKKEALGKLEATKADLLRLGDIISEIEKQVNQLRRQAARARQYSRQKDELKGVELKLASAMVYDSQAKYRDLEIKRDGLKTEIEALSIEYDKREVGLHESRLRLSDLERQAAEQRQVQSEFTAKASEIESEIKLNKHRIESAGEEIVRSRTEITALENRIASLNQGIEDNNRKLSALNEERDSLVTANDSLESELAEKALELTPCEAAVNEARARNTSLAEKVSALKAETASLTEMKRNLEQKLSETKKDAESIDQSRNEGQSDLDILANRHIQLEQTIEETKKSLRIKIESIIEIEKAYSEKRDSLSKINAELSGLQARRELLGQLIESGEGYSSGAKSMMSWTDRPVGMLSPLAEVLEVPDQFRVAVAAALGDRSEIIPVQKFDDAERAISYIKSVDGGRASFFVMERIRPTVFNMAKPSPCAGFIGYLDELTKYPDEYKPVVELLLGRVALFETKEQALGLSGDWDYYTKVDSQGFVVQPSAVVTGGKAAPGVLGRRQDLNSVEDLISQLGAKISELELEQQSAIASLQSSRSDQSEIEKSIRRLEDDCKKVEAELGQLKFDFKERESKYAVALNQAESLGAEIKYYESKLEKIQSELEERDIEQRKGAEELNNLSETLLALRIVVSQLESKLTAARIKLIEHDGLKSKLTSDIEHGRELCGEAEKMIATNKAGIEKADMLIKNAGANNEELETKLYDVFAQRREIQAKLHDVEDSITEFMGEMGKAEDELSQKRKEKERLTSTLHGFELEFLELDSSRKSIMDKLRMEFNITSIEAAPLPEDKSFNDLRSEADEYRSRLQKMDPVNLMAAEDYEREKDRLDFLVRQRDDLLDAENSLKEAIGKINTTAEERFRETFSKIQENFVNVFTTLFEGGEARVELEEENNPLESAIKIMARPGGKRLLSVTQLSGGERALTAISLLFAIYLVKPSPFCILDEVDAPLDDANLMRFLKIIKKFSAETQFIIITHNKMTMEASDILYGVTMETPGVSKVVSVKFARNGNGNGNGNGDKALDGIQ
jgi:chromosome segregation protein